MSSQLPSVETGSVSPVGPINRKLKDRSGISNLTATAPSIVKDPKRARTMPSMNIYRPPAARKLEQNANFSNVHAREMVRGPSPESGKLRYCDEAKELTLSGKRGDSNGMSVFRNAITSIRAQNKVSKCKSVDGGKKNEAVENVPKADETGKTQSKQRRPDIRVYVPKGRRSADCLKNNSGNGGNVSSDNLVDNKDESKQLLFQENNGKVSELPNVTRDRGDFQTEILTSSKNKAEEATTTKFELKPNDEFPPADNTKLVSTSQTNKNSVSNEKSAESIANPQRTLSGTSGEINNSNNEKANDVHLNPEECDWEAMFDDTGECLYPTLLEQLTSAVGDVTIEKPKSTYNEFKTKPLDMMGDEFPHVIEIYNFPPEFQLQDLMTVFSQFKNSGFEIKWVDDTHALGIFSSSAIVSEVLSFYHPFVKTRSLKEGTPLSKLKARRSAEFLLPYKPRPDTCAALARRLVTGALGVKLPTSREEREAEKKILTKAREKKKLEAKQKEDAWEGTFS